MYKSYYGIILLHSPFQIYILSFLLFLFLLNAMLFSFPSQAPVNFYKLFEDLDRLYLLTSFLPKASEGSCSMMLVQYVRHS